MKIPMPCVLMCSMLCVALLAPQPGLACGEGAYNMGKGLRYQGYLAPRPATVLIYNNQATVPAGAKAVYRGLVQTGHTVEVARSPEQAAAALRNHRFDVVIADYDQIDVIGKHIEPASRTRLLPVMTGGAPGANNLRERFRVFLLEGASLGQHLKRIDQLVKDRT